LSTLADNWRALALRGVVALFFGLVVLFWPGFVLAVLTILIGIYAALDGAITFVPALRSQERGTLRTLPLAEGAVGIVAELVALLWPRLTSSGLVYVIAGWALLTGFVKIPILLRTEVQNGWLLAGSGALSALFGVLLIVLAGSDVPYLAPFIGVFAVVVGLALIVFAFRLRERRGCLTGSPCLACWNGYTLGDMRPWVMTHRRAGAYAPVSCRTGANEKPDPQRDVAMDRHPTGREDGLGTA
jgi:uncharacterized membrane protein HdeD (DUF308 family)